MSHDFDYSQILRDCCRDHAAFEKLQQMFESMQASQNQIREALLESEAKNLALLNAIPDLMFHMDRDGRYIDVKADQESDFAIPPSEMLGKTVFDVLPKAVAEKRIEQIELALATGEVQTFEYELTHHEQQHTYEARVAISGENKVLVIVRDITERKQAEAQLRQTTADLQAIFQAFPDLQFRMDAEGRVLDYHAGRGTGLYVPPEQFLGKRLADNLPPPVGGQLQQAIAQVLDTHTLVSFEYGLPTPHGTMLMFEARLLPLPDNQVMVIVRDVTERKQAEESLRLSEEKFSKAFRSSPAAIAISTCQEGRVVEVNNTFLEITGYTRAEVIGRTSADLKLWRHSEERQSMVQILQNQGFVRNLEFEFRTKDDATVVGLFSAELIELNGEPCILSMTNDITDRKHAEAQLQTSLERDRILAEISLRIRRSLNLDQILHTTAEEVRELLKTDRVFIAYLNPTDSCSKGKIAAESVDLRYPAILGFVADSQFIKEQEEILSRGEAIIINDVSKAQLSSMRRNLFKQCEVKASLGVPIQIGDQIYGSLVVNQCSEPRDWQHHEIDLLEKLASQVGIAIQQAELYEQVQVLNASLESQVQERTEQLQQKLQELQELSELKDFFLHAVSHDLRTPIMGMLLVLKSLLAKGCKDTNQDMIAQNVIMSRCVLERIIQSSDRQLEMLNILLDAHAIEANGANSLNFQDSSLGCLIEQVICCLNPLAEANQATLVNLVLPNLPLVHVDQDQIRRVFEKLIINAIKHNPPGLTLTINASVEDVNKGTHEKGCKRFVRCMLQDNGTGVDDGEYLFENYAKGKHAKYSTTIGLALYLCRQIIAAHGGQIGVVSNPNSGATFWFTLPIK